MQKKIEVKTGFGYFKDKKGNIVGKAELPEGEHPLQDDFTYHEVDSKEELDAIQEYVPEKTIEEQKNEIKAKLHSIDLKTIRPLRAGETERVFELEAQAEALRLELNALGE